jgi:hypothetical protein
MTKKDRGEVKLTLGRFGEGLVVAKRLAHRPHILQRHCMVPGKDVNVVNVVTVKLHKEATQGLTRVRAAESSGMHIPHETTACHAGRRRQPELVLATRHAERRLELAPLTDVELQVGTLEIDPASTQRRSVA